MMAHDAVMGRIRTVAELLRTKVDLQRPMPAIQRLRTVARINGLRQQLRSGPLAIPSQNSEKTQ